MIPKIFVEEWRKKAHWQNLYQTEQDLIISRALVDLYNNDHIKQELVFRGGTALNKLFLSPAARYSEDIDFVQKTPNPIGNTIDVIREVLSPWLGIPKWKVTERGAKLFFKYESIDNTPGKLKVEVNTTEHLNVLPFRTEEFLVESGWFKGNADLVTYELDELMGTKLRALYQRRKGRDLFDLWYVVKNKLVDLDQVLDIFPKRIS